MRRAFVAASRAAFNVLYRLSDRAEREDLVVFLSRQTDEASYDYAELAREFQARGYACAMHLKKVRARNMVSYALHVFREIRLLGRCKIAVLDRYDPVVSLIDFACEQAAASGDTAGSACNRDFPARPVVLQAWHAFGAFKKFGFQSVDTPEGHSTSFTSDYAIHRNYSWVLCSGTGARAAFAEAFSCPPERVVPLVRPEYDELVAARESAQAARSREDRPTRILMAPTLRINVNSAHPFRDLYANREAFESAVRAKAHGGNGGEIDFDWSFHPLEDGLPAPGNVSARLLGADVVVTDYSSIAYEAYLLGKPVVFYVPDLQSYRSSPGLNADPGMLSPDICAFSEAELAAMLQRLAADPASYPSDALAAFAASAFDAETADAPGTAASRIVDFVLGKLGSQAGARV